jgi:uncharacterized Zn finger protein
VGFEWRESDKCPYCSYEDSDLEPNEFDEEYTVKCKSCGKMYDVKTKTRVTWYVKPLNFAKEITDEA